MTPVHLQLGGKNNPEILILQLKVRSSLSLDLDNTSLDREKDCLGIPLPSWIKNNLLLITCYFL